MTQRGPHESALSWRARSYWSWDTDHRHIGSAALALVVIIGAWLGFRWWTHPHEFGSAEGRVVLRQGAKDLRTIHILMSGISKDRERQTVHINDAHANVTRNGTKASFEFVICTPRPDHDPFMVTHNLKRSCELVRPAVGADIQLGPAPAYDMLVLTITPTRPGVTEVENVDVDYSYGAGHLWRHGTETTGPSATLKVG